MRSPGFEDANGNHVTVGDICVYAFGGAAEVVEIHQDGEAVVRWVGNGPGVRETTDTVKWKNLVFQSRPSFDRPVERTEKPPSALDPVRAAMLLARAKVQRLDNCFDDNTPYIAREICHEIIKLMDAAEILGLEQMKVDRRHLIKDALERRDLP